MNHITVVDLLILKIVHFIAYFIWFALPLTNFWAADLFLKGERSEEEMLLLMMLSIASLLAQILLIYFYLKSAL